MQTSPRKEINLQPSCCTGRLLKKKENKKKQPIFGEKKNVFTPCRMSASGTMGWLRVLQLAKRGHSIVVVVPPGPGRARECKYCHSGLN